MQILFILIIIVILWVIVIKLRQKRRYPVAEKLLKDKVDELLKDFDKLVEKVDKGYFYEQIVIDKVTYYLGYHITRPGTLEKLDRPGEVVDAITIEMYADCVTILPLIYLKTGPSYKETIEKRFEINKN